MKFYSFLLTCTAMLAAPSIRSGFLTTSDGVRLHYLESGRGPAVLFVPGWTMPAEIWEPQIRHFAPRYRVVAMDPRSQGDSAQTAEGHYPERRAEDIKEVIDQLKLSPVVLACWSMGVPEALTYVDRFGTAALRALVLVDGFFADDPGPGDLRRRWTWVQELQLNRNKLTAKFVRWMYKKPQPEAYYDKVTAASLKTPTNTAVALLANVYNHADWRPVLPKVDRPVLYVITPDLKAQGKILKAGLPSARVEIFSDAGHALFIDEAARFNALVEEFLRTAK